MKSFCCFSVVSVTVTHAGEAPWFVKVYESKARAPVVVLVPGLAFAAAQVLWVPAPLRARRPVCVPTPVTGKLPLVGGADPSSVVVIGWRPVCRVKLITCDAFQPPV